MKTVFTFAILATAFVSSVGCGSSSSSSYTPSTTSNGSMYESEAFQNASPDVQEDVIIYNTLRQMGYSDADSKAAVINTMDQ